MPDLFSLVGRWWKQMLALTILTLGMASAILYLKKPEYMSAATALPANAGANDKASIFNTNIQEIYSALGGSDDVDRILGTGQLDTIYLSVTDQFNLFDHYRLTDPREAARARAARMLKKKTRVFKSEYGELRIKVWDTDRHLAPQLANALMMELERIHAHLRNETNQLVYQRLIKGRDLLEKTGDSLRALSNLKGPSEQASTRLATADQQLMQYGALIAQYELMVDTKPSVLRIVEYARPAAMPDRPQPWLVIVIAGVLSIIFSLVLALILERRKPSRL